MQYNSTQAQEGIGEAKAQTGNDYDHAFESIGTEGGTIGTPMTIARCVWGIIGHHRDIIGITGNRQETTAESYGHKQGNDNIIQAKPEFDTHREII